MFYEHMYLDTCTCACDHLCSHGSHKPNLGAIFQDLSKWPHNPMNKYKWDKMQKQRIAHPVFLLWIYDLQSLKEDMFTKTS